VLSQSFEDATVDLVHFVGSTFSSRSDSSCGLVVVVVVVTPVIVVAAFQNSSVCLTMDSFAARYRSIKNDVSVFLVWSCSSIVGYGTSGGGGGSPWSKLWIPPRLLISWASFRSRLSTSDKARWFRKNSSTVDPESFGTDAKDNSDAKERTNKQQGQTNAEFRHTKWDNENPQTKLAGYEAHLYSFVIFPRTSWIRYTSFSQCI